MSYEPMTISTYIIVVDTATKIRFEISQKKNGFFHSSPPPRFNIYKRRIITKTAGRRAGKKKNPRRTVATYILRIRRVYRPTRWRRSISDAVENLQKKKKKKGLEIPQNPRWIPRRLSRYRRRISELFRYFIGICFFFGGGG